MNDNIHFDTSTVRGFAEWLNHQVNGGQDGGGYASRIDTIIAKLGGSPGSSHDGGGYDTGSESADAQTMGTSGVEYAGKDYGASETKNAEAAVKYLQSMRKSLQGMADAAGVMAEDFTGQDEDNSEGIQEQFKPGGQ